MSLSPELAEAARKTLLDYSGLFIFFLSRVFFPLLILVFLLFSFSFILFLPPFRLSSCFPPYLSTLFSSLNTLPFFVFFLLSSVFFSYPSPLYFPPLFLCIFPSLPSSLQLMFLSISINLFLLFFQSSFFFTISVCLFVPSVVSPFFNP